PLVYADDPLEQALSQGFVHYAQAEDVEKSASKRIRPSLFPPAEDVGRSLHLERCMRVLPHHQDTGGFFVAVLEKTGPIFWKDLTRPEENLGDITTATPSAPATNSLADATVPPSATGGSLIDADTPPTATAANTNSSSAPSSGGGGTAVFERDAASKAMETG
ncbi:unnamed protein product, partial [Discosporangium mesarthrocarpum]